MSVLLLILGLVLFTGLVVVHEYGHFILARRNGVEVEEFGIGFPPRAWSRKLKSGLLFSINWLPIGGFVKLKGENDADKRKGSFGAASISAKSKIMLAGVGMNLLAAFVILTFLAFVGMPKLIDNQFTVAGDAKTIRNEVLVGGVEDNSPASKAGLEVRDELLSIGEVNHENYKITSQDKLPELTKSLAGKDVQISVKRDNKNINTFTTLRSQDEVTKSKSTDNPKGYLGIAPTEYTLTRSTWSAPIVALGLIKQMTILTFQGLGHIFAELFSGHPGQASKQVAGPVGIFVILKDGSLLGYQFVLVIIAVISLTLAIMNVLPIPALDGGRLFVTWFYKIINKPLTKKAEDSIHGTGFALLMLLFVLITIVDIKRFF